MNKILLFINLIILSSCIVSQQDDRILSISKSNPAQIDLSNWINISKGNYLSCIPDTVFAGFFTEASVTITDFDLILSKSLSSNSDCSNPFYISEEKHRFSDAFLVTNNTYDVELVAESNKFTIKAGAFAAWYISQNYCGFADWAVDVTKDITGLSCPKYLVSDPFHSSIRTFGELSYISLEIDSSGNILFPYRFDIESGDTLNDAYKTDPMIITKI